MPENIEFREITLPSKGVLYDGQIPEGKVKIRKLTTREEAILFQQGMQGLDRIKAVIDNCTRLPAGFDGDDLLLQDRMAILLALRTLTLGASYKVPFKCQYCGAMNKCDVDILEDLEQRSPADDLKEPIDVKLEDCGRIVSLRFLRGRDEERIAKRAKRLAMQSNDPGDQSHFHRMALQIVAVDGNESLNLAEKEAFVQQLTIADSSRMRIAIDDKEPGYDLSIFPDCKGCGSTNEMTLPFTAEFFRPTSM